MTISLSMRNKNRWNYATLIVFGTSQGDKGHVFPFAGHSHFWMKIPIFFLNVYWGCELKLDLSPCPLSFIGQTWSWHALEATSFMCGDKEWGFEMNNLNTFYLKYVKWIQFPLLTRGETKYSVHLDDGFIS